MKTGDLSFDWVSEVLSLDVTGGQGTCIRLQLQEWLAMALYPQAHSLNQLWTGDSVLLVENVRRHFWLREYFKWDTVRLVDVFTPVTQYHLQFADIITPDDTGGFNIGFVFYRNEADSIEMMDRFYFGFGTGPGQGVTMSDHGSITMAGYFQTMGPPSGYFATDYFGYSYTW